MARKQRSAASRSLDALVVGFVFALPGWALTQFFEVSVFWALVVPVAVGLLLGWLFGNVLLFLLEVLLGLFD